MEMQDGILHVQTFLAITLGIIVLFAGKRLNNAIGVLREISIPEPVTGGLSRSCLDWFMQYPALNWSSN